MIDTRTKAAHPARSKLTVPQVAANFGISEDKVRAWIASGELRAFNAATKPGGRPRWLIDRADLLVFEQRRASGHTAPTPKRRRTATYGIIEYF
jgi:excisionase family DNA binding protein